MGSSASKRSVTNKPTLKGEIKVIPNSEPVPAKSIDERSETDVKSDILPLTSEELAIEYRRSIEKTLALADEALGETDKKSTKSVETLCLPDIGQMVNEVTDDLVRLTGRVLNGENSSKVSDQGYFPENTIELIVFGGRAATACRGLPLKWREQYNYCITYSFLQSKAIEFICEAFKYYSVHGFKTKNEGGTEEIDETKWKTFYNSALTLSVFSDHSDDLALYLASYPGFLGSVKWTLTKEKHDHLRHKQKAEAKEITQQVLLLTYNLSKRDANVRNLKDFDFTTALEPYLRSSDEKIKLSALASLASIVDEEESEIIAANRETVQYLLSHLQKGAISVQRMSSGWSCHDCVFALRMLARNDANKKMLSELGTVAELCFVLHGGTEDEKYESILTLWALAFDPDIRKQMVEDEVNSLVELIYHLRRTSESDKIKKAANGVLWTMREELKVSKKKIYEKLGLQSPVPKTNTEDNVKENQIADDQDKIDTEQGHIMLSYQWANQKTLILIRDRLQATGLKVWMDIDEMEGSTIQSMAEAVENARIVLMAMSQKYKDSPNCRAEAEYAYKNKKIIIPLLMERGYSPDGWLGFILGTKLFFDFSGKYEFEDKLGEMLKHVAKSLGQTTESEKAIKVVTSETKLKGEDKMVKKEADREDKMAKKETIYEDKNSVPVATKYYQKIQLWSQADVHNWINMHDLNTPRLSQLIPGEICLLLTMRQEAPEFFYKSLRKTLHVKDFLTMSKLVSALTELTKE